MPRIQERRYGRDNEVVASSGATHAIKIGFKNAKGLPDKTNGFYVEYDTIDNNGLGVIDYDAMERLGYGEKSVDSAFNAGFKADPTLLPQMLRFIIMADSRYDTEQACWVFPETFSDSYECYPTAEQAGMKGGAPGLFCRGDGRKAQRKQNDGSTREIECVPFGRGTDAKLYCPFSGPQKPCKLHLRLLVCLYGVNEAGERFLVSPNLGMQARFRFDSTSEYCAIQIWRQLDMASQRVAGRLNGITGTLTFQKRRRRTGGQGAAAGTVVGHVHFLLDEESILAREREIAQERLRQFDRQLEARRANLMIEPPPPVPDSPATIDIKADPIKQGNRPTSAHPAGRAPVLDDREPERQSLPDDDMPFEDQDVEANPVPREREPDEIAVADATDDELIEALGICQHLTAKAFNREPGLQLKRLTECEIDGKKYSGIGRIAYFTEATGEKDAHRRKLLRDTCLGLEARGQAYFIVKRLPAVSGEGWHE